MHPYPRLVIDRDKLRQNIKEITERCKAKGISVAGVIKGMNGLTELIKVYGESDVTMIGSSRIEQLKDVKELGIEKPTMMIRIPMLSEVPEIVEFCDYSLESEDEVLKALNDESLRQGRVHNVILMAEMGDLREGYVDALR